MIEFLNFVAIVSIVVVGGCMMMWFAMGAMHQHLTNKGMAFGRDNELHEKVDKLLERSDATVTTKH